MIWQISHCFESAQTLSGVPRADCFPIRKEEQHVSYVTCVLQDQLVKPKKMLASVRMAKTNACIWKTSPREASHIKIRNSLEAKLVFNGRCLFAEWCSMSRGSQAWNRKRSPNFIFNFFVKYIMGCSCFVNWCLWLLLLVLKEKLINLLILCLLFSSLNDFSGTLLLQVLD